MYGNVANVFSTISSRAFCQITRYSFCKDSHTYIIEVVKSSSLQEWHLECQMIAWLAEGTFGKYSTYLLTQNCMQILVVLSVNLKHFRCNIAVYVRVRMYV